MARSVSFVRRSRSRIRLGPAGFLPEVYADAWVGASNRKPLFRSQHAHHLGESVGNDTVGRDNRDGNPMREAEAGSRVHDVAVAPAAYFHELLRVARSGDGIIG